MLTVVDVLTTCAVAIFSVKVSCITSVDGILTLIIDLIGQLSRDVIGRLSVKVARYSFSGLIPPKFEHKLRRQKQSLGKIATTVVLDKDENLL